MKARQFLKRDYLYLCFFYAGPQTPNEMGVHHCPWTESPPKRNESSCPGELEFAQHGNLIQFPVHQPFILLKCFVSACLPTSGETLTLGSTRTDFASQKYSLYCRDVSTLFTSSNARIPFGNAVQWVVEWWWLVVERSGLMDEALESSGIP